MPELQDIDKGLLGRLKSQLFFQPAQGEVDQTFEETANGVSVAGVVSQTDEGNGKWRGITVKLYNYAIGVPTEGAGADDPDYLGICACPKPRSVHTGESTDLPRRTPKVVDQVFGTFGSLDREEKVRFGVITNAFENDATKAWSSLVSALQGDITSLLNLGVDALPGLSAFATPGAAVKTIGELVQEGAGLLIGPSLISGDKPVIDTVFPIEWFRPATFTMSAWSARMWEVL
jgi:hypothetical protein